MVNWLARASHTVNRLVPGLKDALPKPLCRWLLLNVLKVNAPFAAFESLASRRFMENDVLLWVRDRSARILFVGTASYTHHYAKLFAADDDQLTTMDINSAMSVWGAPNHIVGPIQEILRFRSPGTFDSVILNGVFGFGVNDTAEMRRTVEAIHAVLKPGGLLIVGWNKDLHADPNVLGLYDGLFTPGDATPWGRRVTYESETHVYDFHIRRPD
jgi:SAM-dependent methyltransferase